MTRTEGGRRGAARRLGLLALPLLVAGTFAACGDDSDDESGLGGGDPTGQQQDDGQDPGAAGGEDPAAGAEDPAAGAEDPAAGAEDPAAGAEDPAAGGGGGGVPSGISELDSLVQSCGSDDWEACDEIYDTIADGSYDTNDPTVQEYLIYGDTCAGNQDAGTVHYCQNSME